MGYGQHLIIDISNCNINRLVNLDIVYNFILGLSKRLNMTNITLPYVVRWLDRNSKIRGISGFSMKEESHIAICTYPEKKFIYADIFSSSGFNTRRIIDYFLETFEGTRYDKKVIKRGFSFN